VHVKMAWGTVLEHFWSQFQASSQVLNFVRKEWTA
jgi:hypothetical protein